MTTNETDELDARVRAKIADSPLLAGRAEAGRARVEIGTRLQELREAAGLSQIALSQRSGVQQATISAIENATGENGATIGTLARLAGACGYKLDIAFRPAGAEETAPADVAQNTGSDAELAALFTRLGELARELWPDVNRLEVSFATVEEHAPSHYEIAPRAQAEDPLQPFGRPGRRIQTWPPGRDAAVTRKGAMVVYKLDGSDEAIVFEESK
jgi:transcriptional regulator with XRE-family HTH domain